MANQPDLKTKLDAVDHLARCENGASGPAVAVATNGAHTVDLAAVGNLLRLFSNHRWMTYPAALEIAACLHAEYGDDASVFDIWSQAAWQVTAIFDADWAASTWKRAATSKLEMSLATLHWWACSDDPSGFIAYRAKHLLPPAVRVQAVRVQADDSMIRHTVAGYDANHR